MTNFTHEQNSYIIFTDHCDTKLIATAGSGKTFTIIQKMNYLIQNKIFDNKQILMLTFSKFTRDDFINRINKSEIKTIDTENIKTIDSFAKSIIDPNNEVDVGILSYKLMKYLETTPSYKVRENEIIKNIKTIFVDEAQDLNETQYKILCLLKKKNKTLINLIGDPNQNIYQFRGSSDKYLTQFDAKTFYLTYNFRSHKEIVDFSKYLRPNQEVDIICKKESINKKPVTVFYKNEEDLEHNLLALFQNANKHNIDLCEFAILAPTRGRMRSNGKSNGLCLISNILFKNNLKFKQFYEESTDELNGNIQYVPESGHVNILTFMGSKGLEWKYTIIIDAETCLINKNQFNEEKHKNDQYLLYVACSRAINNLFIFSKYSIKCDYNPTFHFNQWFSLIPQENYRRDERFDGVFKFQEIKERNVIQNEKRINKILDNISEKTLYDLAVLCNFGVGNSKKEITNLYNVNCEKIHNNSNAFISKYLKELFFAYCNLGGKSANRKKYVEIENIINLDIIMKDLTQNFVNWYLKNKYSMTWEIYDKEKHKYSDEIRNIVDGCFNRNKNFSEHIVVYDGFFKSFILDNIDEIRDNYEKYLKCSCYKKIQKYLFKIIVLIYAMETQHYYHVLNKGKKFKHILVDGEKLFDEIKNYAFNFNEIKETNIKLNKGEFTTEIDMVDINNQIFDIKCFGDVTLKHIVMQIVGNIIYNNLENKAKSKITLNFINLTFGKITKININLTKEKIEKIEKILFN